MFTLGVLAAGIVSAGHRIRRLPWLGLAALAGAPVLTLIALRGSAWTAAHYYWLDLAVGQAIALFLAAPATRRPVRLVRLLNGRPLQALGGFSYSLYLVHMPIVALISTLIVIPHAGSHLAAFTMTVALAIPVCLATARLFAAVFEFPFQRHRWTPSAVEVRFPVTLLCGTRDRLDRGTVAFPPYHAIRHRETPHRDRREKAGPQAGLRPPATPG